MINFIKKLIPVEIKIKSLYWKEKEKEMESDLQKIFNKLDIDDYSNIPSMIYDFRKKWGSIFLPSWLSIKSTEITRAEAMYDFLTTKFE